MESDVTTHHSSSVPVPPAFARTDLSRRTMLRGLGVVGIGALLSQCLSAGTASAATTPNRAARRAAAAKSAPAGKLHKQIRSVGDGPLATQPTPYYLQASSELSQDYFLTDDVIIGTDDEVIAFVNPFNNGAVEAIVFAGGTLSHLRRDAMAASGWSYEAIDLQGVLTSVNDVAVAASGQQVYLLAFGQPGDETDNPVGAPAWLTKLDAANTWDPGALATWDDLNYDSTALRGPIKGGISPEGSCYFYTDVVNGSTSSLIGWVASSNWDYDPLTYQLYLTLDTSSHSVEDYLVLYDTAATNPVGYALVYTSDGELSVYQQQGTAFSPDPLTTSGAQNVTGLLWAWATPGSTTGTPGYAFQQATGTVLVDEAGNVAQLWAQSKVGQNQAAVWLQNGLYTVNLLDINGILNIVQETSNQGTGTWAPALPVTPGLAAIYGVPTDPNESTLFAVGLDETLSVLTLDASGWTQTQVHQDGATLQEIGSYRIQASTLDSNGVGVAQGKVQISTDRPIGFWQASGNTVLTPAAPVTMTADLKGEITFSIPAEEIDCAVLAVQALDPNGSPSGSPFTVTPDTDVRSFLNGTGSLSDIGPMTGAALLAAQNADGTSLLPTLTTLPSDQQQAAATATSGALNQLIAAGTAAAPAGPNAIQSFKLDMSSGTPTFQTSTNPSGLSQVGVGTVLTLSFSHLFDTIGHALRHAALEFKTVVVQWSDDAKSWIVNLVVKIGADILNFGNLVITDMKDAFHVIGGFFQALGSDILHTLEWLERNVLALLKETGANASTIQGWLTAAPGELTTVVSGIESGVNKFFSSKEQAVHTLIQGIETKVEDITFGSSAPLVPPTNDSGSASTEAELAKSLAVIGKVMNDAPGKWLMDKFLAYLPVTDPGPKLPDVFSPLIDDLATDWADAIQFSEGVITLIEATAKELFSTKAQVAQTQMTAWFSDLDATVTDGLQLLDAVADTVLDLTKATITVLGDYFSYEYQVTSELSIIGLILDEAGIDPTISLAQLVSLVIAFPATLIGKIRGYDSLFPAATPSADDKSRNAVSGSPDDWQVGLGICGAVAQGVWGMADLIGDVQSFTDPSTGERGTASGLIDYFDIICPILETVFLWPSKSNADGSTAYPFYGGIATDTKDYGLLPGIIYSAIIPSCFGIATKMKDSSAGTSGGTLPSGVADPFADYYGPVIQMISGITNTALGAAYSSVNDQGAAAIAGGVLGNLSFVLAPLETKWLNESTEDVPVLTKTVVDAVGNVGAAVCIAESASLPPK